MLLGKAGMLLGSDGAAWGLLLGVEGMPVIPDGWAWPLILGKSGMPAESDEIAAIPLLLAIAGMLGACGCGNGP